MVLIIPQALSTVATQLLSPSFPRAALEAICLAARGVNAETAKLPLAAITLSDAYLQDLLDICAYDPAIADLPPNAGIEPLFDAISACLRDAQPCTMAAFLPTTLGTTLFPSPAPDATANANDQAAATAAADAAATANAVAATAAESARAAAAAATAAHAFAATATAAAAAAAQTLASGTSTAERRSAKTDTAAAVVVATSDAVTADAHAAASASASEAAAAQASTAAAHASALAAALAAAPDNAADPLAAPAPHIVSPVALPRIRAWAQSALAAASDPADNLLATSFAALCTPRPDGSCGDGLLRFAICLLQSDRGEDASSDNTALADLLATTRALLPPAYAHSALRPAKVFELAAAAIDGPKQVPRPFALHTVGTNSVYAQIALSVEWGSSDPAVRNAAALGACHNAASFLQLHRLLQFLEDIPSTADAVQQLLRYLPSGFNAIVSESALHALETCLTQIEPSLLTAPAASRPHTVAEALRTASEADKAANQPSSTRPSRQGAADAETDITWNKDRLASLRTQVATPAALVALNFIGPAPVPALAFYAVFASGSPIATQLVFDTHTAALSGVPTAISDTAALHASVRDYLTFALVHGPELSFAPLPSPKAGEPALPCPLIPAAVTANLADFTDSFPRDVLTDALLKHLMARRLSSVRPVDLAHLCQGALAVRYGIDIARAPSLGACPNCLWLLSWYLRPFLSALGFQCTALSTFLNSLQVVCLVRSATGLPTAALVDEAITLLFNDAEQRFRNGTLLHGGPSVMPSAFDAHAPAGLWLTQLTAGLDLTAGTNRADRAKGGSRLQLLSPTQAPTGDGGGGGGRLPQQPPGSTPPTQTPASALPNPQFLVRAAWSRASNGGATPTYPLTLAAAGSYASEDNSLRHVHAGQDYPQAPLARGSHRLQPGARGEDAKHRGSHPLAEQLRVRDRPFCLRTRRRQIRHRDRPAPGTGGPEPRLAQERSRQGRHPQA